MQHQKLFVLSIILLLSPTTVLALRCGHELVDLGDYQEDVIEKCGEPYLSNSHVERRGGTNSFNGSRFFAPNPNQFPNSAINYGQQQYVEIEMQIDEWVYDFGRRKLKQYLRFENGRLIEIKPLGRGKN